MIESCTAWCVSVWLKMHWIMVWLTIRKSMQSKAFSLSLNCCVIVLAIAPYTVWFQLFFSFSSSINFVWSFSVPFFSYDLLNFKIYIYEYNSSPPPNLACHFVEFIIHISLKMELALANLNFNCSMHAYIAI